MTLDMFNQAEDGYSTTPLVEGYKRGNGKDKSLLGVPMEGYDL